MKISFTVIETNLGKIYIEATDKSLLRLNQFRNHYVIYIEKKINSMQ